MKPRMVKNCMMMWQVTIKLDFSSLAFLTLFVRHADTVMLFYCASDLVCFPVT